MIEKENDRPVNRRSLGVHSNLLYNYCVSYLLWPDRWVNRPVSTV